MADIKEYYTTAQATRILGCHPTWIRHLINRGEIEHYDLGEMTRYLIPKEALTPLLADKERGRPRSGRYPHGKPKSQKSRQRSQKPSKPQE